MEIYSVRLKNVEQIIATRFGGVKAHFADSIHTSPVTVQRWWSSSGKLKRNIGSRTARKIEEIFSLSHGWLDTQHEHYDDLEQDIQRKTTLKLQHGNIHTIPLRQQAAVDQDLRLTLLDHKEGNLMLLSTDETAYALQLVGHNPMIWLSNNWVILVEPNTPLEVNECALLKLATGELLLRLVVHISEDMLIVRNMVTGTQDNLLKSQIAQAEYAYIGIPPSKVRLAPPQS